MKIVKILGGLGNQMFQFSFYLFLRNSGIETKLDITDFEKYKLHNGLELINIFNINQDIIFATAPEIKACKDQLPFIKIRKKIGGLLFNNTNIFIRRSHWIEPEYSHFYKNIPNLKQIYLDGYWQNESYLKQNEHLIRHSFQWLTLDVRNIEMAHHIAREENIVAVHIRRFDKPKNLKQLLYTIRLFLVWRIASRDYYIKAIDYMSKHLTNPNFLIFTDNINWVKKNISIKTDYTIVDWNRGNKSNQDMFLMTQCKHNIISMSSFSWWGAWLNNNPKKIVIAPKKWAPRFSKDEIIPKEWIRL